MPGKANEQGIISISFLPTFGESADITPKICELFHESEKIRASIAFWTLSFQDLLSILHDPSLLQAIKSDDSFLCCDIQLPTNMDALASLKQAKVDVFLNFRRLIPALKKMTSSLGLLHTKMILADKKDGTAEIWVGSHNWTQFALRGINTEISVVLKVEKSSSLYCEAYQFLKHIRSFCDEFDLNKVDEYKKLQVKDSVADEAESVIIDLEGLNLDSLSNSSIWLFGTEDRDYTSLRNVGKPVKLILTDSITQKKYLYNASIIQTGQMEAYNFLANGLQFTGQKRHAFSNYGMFPVLEPPGPLPVAVESDAKFFVAVQILDKLSENFNIRSASENKINLWENAISDPILSLEKVRSCYREASHSRKNDFTSLIQVPYFNERASSRQTGKDEYLLQPLEIKRERREYQFVSKGVIRVR
jgi:hypothetical protein